MKKLLTLITVVVVVLVALTIQVSAADLIFTYEPRDYNSKIDIQLTDVEGSPVLRSEGALTEINGEKYFYQSFLPWRHPVKYSAETYDFFKDKVGYYDCIWTGEYYVTREAINIDPKTIYPDNRAKGMKTPLRFYDANFNLVREQYFDGLPLQMEYYNGVYYCFVWGGHSAWSIDTVNWTQGNFPGNVFPEKIGNGACNYEPSSSEGEGYKLSVSIAEINFFEVDFEDQHYSVYGALGRRFGEWTFRFNGKTLSFSNDNIYYVKAEIPEEIATKNRGGAFIIDYAYEYEDDIVVVTQGFVIRTPKQPIYDELERMKNAAYVKVNNKLLGFETPPVIEDGRMLVPMRFLFEQMGATVDWNNETQTATVRENGKEITFSIDSTKASLGSEAKTMDVPAKLINDKTMVPLRFLSEGLGYTVQWDESTRIATIKWE